MSRNLTMFRINLSCPLSNEQELEINRVFEEIRRFNNDNGNWINFNVEADHNSINITVGTCYSLHTSTITSFMEKIQRIGNK